MLIDDEWEEGGKTGLSSRGMLQSITAAVLGTLRRRWRTLLIVCAVVLIAGSTAVMLIPPTYVGVARVRIEPSRAAVLGDLSGVRPDQGAIDTEASVIRSRAIIGAAVERLGLDREPTLGNAAPPKAAGGAGRQARIDAATARIIPKLAVTREGLTYIVAVRYESPDPRLAAAVASGVARAYIAYNEQRRVASLSRESEFLDARLKAAESQARAADARLAQYRASAGIVRSGDATLADQQVNPLAAQVATAESEAAAAQARLAAAQRQSARGGIDAVSAVLNSPVIASLRGQRAILVEKQGEIATRYGERHPESIKITQQLAAIDDQIDREAKRVIGGLESEAEASLARAASLRADLQRLEGAQASDARKAAVEQGYARDADTARIRYNALITQQQAQAASQTTVPQAVLVDDASVPGRPAAPNRPLLLMAVALLALFSGTAVVATQEMLATGVRSVDDIEDLDLPLLATIPTLDHDSGHASEAIVRRPMSGFAEAYRVARRALFARVGAPRTIAIVSALPGEGKTTSALALGRVMAMAGERVVIIDTDLRRVPALPARGVAARPGLVAVLRHEASLNDALVADSVERCYRLPATGGLFLAEDLLGSEAMRGLVDRLIRDFDRVIFDTAPLLGVADARAVAGLAEAVVVTVRWGHTPLRALRNALTWLRMDKARVVGVILTMVAPSAKTDTGLYHSRRYAGYYLT